MQQTLYIWSDLTMLEERSIAQKSDREKVPWKIAVSGLPSSNLLLIL